MGVSVGNRVSRWQRERLADWSTRARSKASTKVIDDFDRAGNVEALRRIQETGEDLFLAMVSSQARHVEQEMLLWRLK